METSKKKKNDPQPRMSFWRQHYPLIVVILMLFVMYQYTSLLENPTSQEHSYVIYPFLTWVGLIEVIIVYLIIPILFLRLMRTIITKKQTGEYNSIVRWSNFIAFALMLCVGSLMTLKLMLVLATGDSYSHQDKLRVNSQSYVLASHFVPYDELNYDSYVIFECDNNGIVCSKIFETLRVNGATDSAELAFDAETQAINIIIDSEVVHTHLLEDR